MLTIVLTHKKINDDTYINENKTSTFKKGDTVVMHSCGEANFYKGNMEVPNR
jgi:hypothetical protein